MRRPDSSIQDIPSVTHLERLRKIELDLVRELVPVGSRILELGGGNGYQAALLSSWGYQVTSIDVASPNSVDKTYFPVALYDGMTLKYDDEGFDVVFSSNVLEHVNDLESLLAECKRVTKKSGLSIHILPSPSWRFWTSLAHYPHVALRVLGIRRPISASALPSVTEKIGSKGFGYVIKRALIAGPHGEYPSALSEMYYFCRRRWMKVFREAGFTIERVVGSGIFYTGYELFPGWSPSFRKVMANALGSATSIYLIRPK